MSILHKTLIPYKTRSFLKESKGRRSMNYKDAHLIGILFSMGSQEEYEAIRQFDRKLRKEGKEVKVLCFLPEKAENYDFQYDVFKKKDFSAMGALQAENVKQFIETPFDLLICLDRNPNLYIEYLLAACRASYRAGAHSFQGESLLELMIRHDKNEPINELINQIYHYTNEL